MQVIDRARVPIIMAALLGMLSCHCVTGPCVGNLKHPSDFEVSTGDRMASLDLSVNRKLPAAWQNSNKPLRRPRLQCCAELQPPHGLNSIKGSGGDDSRCELVGIGKQLSKDEHVSWFRSLRIFQEEQELVARPMRSVLCL